MSTKTNGSAALAGPRPSLYWTESKLGAAIARLDAVDPDEQMSNEEASDFIAQFVNPEAVEARRDEFATFILEAESFADAKLAMADAMRRLILKPLRERFGEGDGQGLRFLELAAGAGTATRFVRLAFPKAKIVVTDLSEPYLKLARERLREFDHLDFMQADAAALPFQDASFDAVFSVFLFHELPLDARQAVLAESRRVLKPGGFHGLVDSIQSHDHPPYAPLLERFPVDFHEPYYRDYAARPIEQLVEAAGLPRPRVERGFFSKVVF
jgi:ubiquinone/menaquinone biosynthesis C-methylase UbiE